MIEIFAQKLLKSGINKNSLMQRHAVGLTSLAGLAMSVNETGAMRKGIVSQNSDVNI